MSPFAVFEAEVDDEPDGFTFTDRVNVQPKKVQTSNLVTISDINVAVEVSVVGGTYSKNGGAYTSALGTAEQGDTFAVRHTSGSKAKTTVSTTLTVGGISDTFSSTTVPGKK